MSIMVRRNDKAGISRGWAHIALMYAVVLSLGACDTVSDTFDRWRGKGPAPPLPGERISVLANDRTLSADDALAGKPIMLPAPTTNVSWPQAGGYANHAMHHTEVAVDIHRVWKADIGVRWKDQDQIALVCNVCTIS